MAAQGGPIRGPYGGAVELEAAPEPELQLEVSNRAIAEALGVSHQTIGRDAGPNGPADDREAQENGNGSGPDGPPGTADGRREAPAPERWLRKSVNDYIRTQTHPMQGSRYG
jgi:hypothetical protein